MEIPTIIEALESREFFLPVIKTPETWRSWEMFLRALYGLPMTSEEQVLFERCTRRRYEAGRQFHEAYCVCGRRGGKSRIASIICAYEAIFGNWSERLGAGETGWIFCIACDRQQARIVLDYVRDILEHFPDLIERQSREEIALKNQITIAVKTCSFRGSRGFSTAVIIADEIAYWRDENSQNPADEVITALLPGLVPGGKLLALSTPYGRWGFLYQVWKENYGRNDSDILVLQASTRLMNPAYSVSNIKRLVARDPARFQAEFEAEFRADLETYISLEVLEAITEMCISCRPPEQERHYIAFVDASAGRSDSFTAAVAHWDKDMIVVDRAEEFRAPFDPRQVVHSLCEVLRAYRIREVHGDRFGGNWVSGSFQEQGIRYVDAEFDKSEIYTQFLAIANMKKVCLIDSERARLQFQGLERRTHSGGRDMIEHAEGAHDDLCNAIAGVVVEAYHRRALSPEEQDALLPRPLKNPTREKLVDGIRGVSQLEKVQRAARDEWDETVEHWGWSPIVRR
jgi:hypothetical protein